MNAQDLRSSVTQLSDSLLIGLLALSFALSDGLAQLLLGIAFIASFAAFVTNGYRQRTSGRSGGEP